MSDLDRYQKRMVALRRETDVAEIQFRALDKHYSKMHAEYVKRDPNNQVNWCDADTTFMLMVSDRRKELRVQIDLLKMDADLIQELRTIKIKMKEAL